MDAPGGATASAAGSRGCRGRPTANASGDAASVMERSAGVSCCMNAAMSSSLLCVARSSEVVLAPGDLLFNEARCRERRLGRGRRRTGHHQDDRRRRNHRRPPGPRRYLGEISLLTQSPAGHRARAKAAVRLLQIPAPVFLRSASVMSGRVGDGAAHDGGARPSDRAPAAGTRADGRAGRLAAGLAHELNNPAAAAKRAAALLKEQVAALEPLAQRLASREWSPAEVALLGQLAAVTGRGDQ